MGNDGCGGGVYVASMHIAHTMEEFNMERKGGGEVNCVKTGGGRTLCIHYVEQKKCTAIGSLHGLYHMRDA